MDAVLHSQPTAIRSTSREHDQVDARRAQVDALRRDQSVRSGDALVELPQALIIHPSVAARTTREFITLAKREPASSPMARPGSHAAAHVDGTLEEHGRHRVSTPIAACPNQSPTSWAAVSRA